MITYQIELIDNESGISLDIKYINAHSLISNRALVRRVKKVFKLSDFSSSSSTLDNGQVIIKVHSCTAHIRCKVL
jgi:hypothetical protein